MSIQQVTVLMAFEPYLACAWRCY